MSGLNRCDFAVRSRNLILDPYGGGALVYRTLFDQQAQGDAWRIIHAYSKTAAAFELRIGWSGGEGSGLEALVTVARATRICVYARALKIEAANLYSSQNNVLVIVPDGFMPTENQYEIRGSQNASEQSVTIPPFAKNVRLDLDNSAAYTTSYLSLRDAQGAIRTQVFADQQPPGGIPLGSTQVCNVLATTAFRVTYELHL